MAISVPLQNAQIPTDDEHLRHDLEILATVPRDAEAFEVAAMDTEQLRTRCVYDGSVEARKGKCLLMTKRHDGLGMGGCTIVNSGVLTDGTGYWVEIDRMAITVYRVPRLEELLGILAAYRVMLSPDQLSTWVAYRRGHLKRR